MYSGGKSESLIDRKRMRIWQELLPGIEEFLSETLATESLSSFAEQRRQYFLERIDIIKLPPTLPPRKGRVIPPEVLEDTEARSGIPANNSNSDFIATQRAIARSWAGSTGHVHHDGASSRVGAGAGAANRKSMCDDSSRTPSMDELDGGRDRGVKEYVDIDTSEIQEIRSSPSRSGAMTATDTSATTASTINNNSSSGSNNNNSNDTFNPYDDEEMNLGTSQAEIDALIHHGVLSSSTNSNININNSSNNNNNNNRRSGSVADLDGSDRHGPRLSARTSSLAGSAACLEENSANNDDDAFRQPSDIVENDHEYDDDDDDKENDYEIPVARQQLGSEDGGSVCMATPPLPKRGLKFSDSGSRNSVEGGGGGGGDRDETPPELPYRPPLPRRNEVYASRSGFSDKSDADISADGNGDSTSYETFDEDDDPSPEDLKGKLGIKLPRRAPKKKSGLKQMTKKSLMKSRSLSATRGVVGVETNVPFRKLANIDISGELLHKGKLTWNRRLAAITHGCLALYKKPDKAEARPVLVIALAGYEASVDEREGRKGFEVRLVHPQDDAHLFAVDFREWALLWKEHINEVARGGVPAKYHTHLARTTSGDIGTSSTSHSNISGSKQQPFENVRFSLTSDYDEIEFNNSSIHNNNDNDNTGNCVAHHDNDNVFREEDEQEYDELDIGGQRNSVSVDGWTWGDTHSDTSSLLTVSSCPCSRAPSAPSTPSPTTPTISTTSNNSTSTTTTTTTNNNNNNNSRGIGVGAFALRDRTIAEILRRRKPVHHPRHHQNQNQYQHRKAVLFRSGDTSHDTKKAFNTADTAAAAADDDDNDDDPNRNPNCSRGSLLASHAGQQHPSSGPVAAGLGQVPGSRSPRLSPAGPGLTRQAASASTLSLSRLDWKSVLYNWSTPLDQVIMTLRRRPDLAGSTSNLSTGSDGMADDSTRPRLRSGSRKVMRMGSFAFRASQFFENIGRRSTSATRRKLSTQSSNDSMVSTKSYSCQDNTHAQQQGCNGGILEESSLSSSSTSNNNNNGSVLTPTSDLSMPVFSDANSSSVPNSPRTPVGAKLLGRSGSLVEGRGRVSMDLDPLRQGSSDEGMIPEVTHKGHLYIFSTFNRRRWGKRWCLVRNNLFECYRSSSSPPGSLSASLGQCEITVTLGNCIMRRAFQETNSPLALMLLEAEKEVITVEPVSQEEMSGWVQVLMAETATLFVPEGLEEYVKKPELDSHSLLSFSVLKQWDMDLSTHNDYEDPGEISSSAKSETSVSNDRPTDLASKEMAVGGQKASVAGSDLPILEALEKQQVTCTPALNSHNSKTKNTTDSGFYSVKGNNSDSDIEDAQPPPNATGCVYSMAQSDGDHFEIRGSLSVSINDETSSPEANIISSCADAGASEDDDMNHQPSGHQSCCCSSSTTYCLAQSITDTTPSSTLVTHSDARHPSSPSTKSAGSRSCQSSQSDGKSATTPSTSKSQSKMIGEDNHVIDLSTEPDNQSEMVVCNPDSKNVYTRVLKHSERSKSVTPENSVPSSYVLEASDSSSPPKCDVTEPVLNQDDNEVFQDLKDLTLSSNQDDYEEVNVPKPTSISTDQHQLSRFRSTISSHTQNDSCNSEQFSDLKSESEEEKAENCAHDQKQSVNTAKDITTSNPKVLSSQGDTPKVNKCQNPLEAEAHLESLISSIADLQLQDNANANSEDVDLSDLLPNNQPTVSSLSSDIACSSTISTTTPSTATTTTATIENPTSSRPLLHITVDSAANGDVLNMDAPASPSAICVSFLVTNPNITEEELTKALEKLKEKKSHLKRKRIAVHDKRQRVSSDEERLVCEKEFASLERDAEAVDQDIGLLHTHLEKLFGQSVELFNAQIKKHNSGSRKRRGKRN